MISRLIILSSLAVVLSACAIERSVSNEKFTSDIKAQSLLSAPATPDVADGAKNHTDGLYIIVDNASDIYNSNKRRYDRLYWPTRIMYGGGGLASLYGLSVTAAGTAGIGGAVAAVGALVNDIFKEDSAKWIFTMEKCGEVIMMRPKIDELKYKWASKDDMPGIMKQFNMLNTEICSASRECLRASMAADISGTK